MHHTHAQGAVQHALAHTHVFPLTTTHIQPVCTLRSEMHASHTLGTVQHALSLSLTHTHTHALLFTPTQDTTHVLTPRSEAYHLAHAVQQTRSHARAARWQAPTMWPLRSVAWPPRTCVGLRGPT